MIVRLRDRTCQAVFEPLLKLASREVWVSRMIFFARTALALTFALGALLSLVVLYAAWSVNESGVSLRSGKAPSWDFTNLWIGARLALSGQISVLFDVDAYRSVIERDVAKFLDVSEWSYPPPMLFVGAPFAYLHLNVAHGLWTITTLVLFLVVLRAAGANAALYALIIFSPAAIMNVVFGQNGALTAALLIGGLVVSDRRALVGGALIGLLIIKPHAAVLAPVCFLAARNYAAFVVAGVTLCLIMIASAAAFGLEVWTGFFQVTTPLMVSYLEEAYLSAYQTNGVSVFLLARSLGADLPTAYAGQAAIACIVIAVTWSMWSQPAREPLLRAAATGLLTLLVTPYGYVYELLCLPLAGILLAMRSGWRTASAMLILALCWIWPVAAPFVTRTFLPLTPFVAVIVAWACWKALRESGTSQDSLALQTDGRTKT